MKNNNQNTCEIEIRTNTLHALQYLVEVCEILFLSDDRIIKMIYKKNQ